MPNLLKRVVPLGAMGMAVMFGAHAWAQLDVVTTTAQRVEQNLQSVPVAVTSLGAEELFNNGGVNIEQIQRLVPSLNFRKGTTTRNSALFLRGVGTISFSIAAEPSVSTVVDGVVMARSGQAFSDLYDVQRIEVLRGPQGTLFGKNASAGLLNIVTKGGANEFEASVEASLTDDAEYRTKVSVAGPIADGLTGRITGFFGTYEGNIRNVFNDKDINGYDRHGVRGVLDWEMSDTADISLKFDYYEADDDCCTEITGVSRGEPQDSELGFDNTLGTDTRFVNHNLTTRTIDKSWGVSLHGDFDVFTDHTLSIIAAYRQWDNTEVREGDFLPRPFVGQFELHDLGIQEFEQFSFEARIASPQDQTVAYQMGAFFWRSEAERSFTREDIVCDASDLPADPTTGAIPCNLADTMLTSFPTSTALMTSEFTNAAVFGQATWNVTDSFRFIGGLRVLYDEVGYTHVREDGFDLVTDLPASGPGVRAIGNDSSDPLLNPFDTQQDDIDVIGKAAIQYDFNDDVMAYFSYTRGYKGGAFNVFYNHTAPGNAAPIGPEKSDVFEAGLKSRLFDDRLQLNIAGFYGEYRGYQANNFVDLGGTIVTNLTNAGTVSTTGFEIEFVANPVDNWLITGGVAFADAKVEEFNPDPLTNAPDARDGTKLPLAPELQASITSDYLIPLDSLGVNADAHFVANWSYTDEQFSDLGEGGPLDDYHLVNLSLGFSDKDDTYRLTFFVRNLFDESFATLNTGSGVRLHIPREADRYFGVNFRATFN